MSRRDTPPPEVEAVEIKVLDRSYKLASPAAEVDSLRAAAAYLDAQMRDLRRRNKSSNGEKLAVVAALNIASELLALRARSAAGDQTADQLAAIDEKLRQALEQPAPATGEA